MLLYANSDDILPIGLEIEISEGSILFTQEMGAEIQAEIDELEDDNTETKTQIYTYRVIVDVNVFDANVERQFNATFKPMKNGLYPFGKSKGISLERFELKAKNTQNSKAFYFGSNEVQKQIADTGFKALYFYEGKHQKVLTLQSIDAVVVGASRKGYEIKINIE